MTVKRDESIEPNMRHTISAPTPVIKPFFKSDFGIDK